MSTATLFECNKCKSVNQSNEFRLNSANFSQVTVSFYAAGGGSPHMMPGGSQSTADNRNETFHICSECKIEMLAELDALIAPLKA